MTLFDDPIVGFERSVLVWGETWLPTVGKQQFLSGELPLNRAHEPAEVLIAPAALLLRAADPSWKPSSALAVLTGPGRGHVNPDDVDRFWKLFRVPCFERLCEGNTVIAAECEAHDGLHLLDDVPEISIHGQVLLSGGSPVAHVADSRKVLCGCGRTVRKIYGVTPMELLCAA